ncbi:MAG: ABC transporter ATP-binding protein [Betaproteobacteria bacterium]
MSEMGESREVIQARGVEKSYGLDGVNTVHVLRGVDLTISRGETVSIVGSSGSGKSTLLHILGGLDLATKGDVLVHGVPFASMRESQICEMRNREIGFVYQFHHLLVEFTAIENVLMPLMIRGKVTEEDRDKGVSLLSRVGLEHRLDHLPSELSGGERQRVAIARALVTDPSCVLADEPTGNLDKSSAKSFMNLVFDLNKDLKTSVVLVTHDHELADMAHRSLLLDDGLLHDR